MSFGKPCRDRGSESLIVDDFDLFRGALTLERDSLTLDNIPEETFSHYSIPAFDNGMLPEKESGGNIKSNKYLIRDGVFLMSKLNPRTPRVWLPSENCIHKKICSTEFLVCRPSASIGIPFGYCLAKSSSIVKNERFSKWYIKQPPTGSTRRFYMPFRSST